MYWTTRRPSLLPSCTIPLSRLLYTKKVFLFLFCSSVGGSHSLLMCVGLFSSERGERGRKQLRRYRWPFLFLSSVETPTLVQANRFFFLFLFSFPFYHGLVLWARNHRFSVGSRTSVLKFKKMGPNCACEMNEPDATTNPREFEYIWKFKIVPYITQSWKNLSSNR